MSALLGLNVGVKYKNSDGSLKIYKDRLEWNSLDEPEGDIVINLSDIKVQKISPEIPDKLYLKIILANDKQYLFHFFTNVKEDDISNRENVKQTLAKLIPINRKKENSLTFNNLDSKNKLLSSNTKLYQLYKDLVISGLVTPEEFWVSPLIVSECGAQADSVLKTIIKTTSARIGIPTGFWSTLAPESRGCNEISLNLTNDYIDAIFLTYPSVKAKFEELVPTSMSDKEFWTQFFQAQYFFRDRTKCAANNKNFFIEIFKEADNSFKHDNCSSNNEKIFNFNPAATLPEGYGGNEEDESEHQLSTFRRFNLQSRMLLKTFQSEKTEKQIPLNNPFEISDLNDVTINEQTSIPLDIEKFCASASTKFTETKITVKPSNPQCIFDELKSWGCDNYAMIFPTTETSVPKEPRPLHKITDETKLEELSQHYKIIYELLRLYWNCYPVSSSNLPTLHRIMTSIEKYNTTTLIPWFESCNDSSLQHHINEMIRKTQQKYAATCSRTSKKPV